MATVDETHNIYTCLMGTPPMNSSRGNNYVLIMYVNDDNGN